MTWNKAGWTSKMDLLQLRVTREAASSSLAGPAIFLGNDTFCECGFGNQFHFTFQICR